MKRKREHFKEQVRRDTVEQPANEWDSTLVHDRLDEGSGATGGDLTGETTPGGMSEDLSRGMGWTNGEYGGATGGDLGHGGAGSGRQQPETAPVESGFHHETETGMAQKAEIENTKAHIREETTHES